MLFGSRGLRATTRITLVFFTWMILYPTLAAAAAPAPPAPASAASSAPNFLEDLRDTALRARDKAGKGQAHDSEDQALVQSEAALAGEESQAEAGFAEVERHLQEHHLPAEIQQRQQQALADYRAKMKDLKAKLHAFTQAHGRNDRAQSQSALNDLAGFLEKEQKTRTQQPFDPKNLPFGTPDDQVRAPREKKEDLDQIIQPKSRVKVAATDLSPGLLAAADPVPGAIPTPEDLAETEDVQITPAIKAQAEALHNNPVEIYHFVRNSVEFLPTYGSIQGSDLTLQTLRGNAFDTASLLIALLRAAQIPARYVYGTIQVPAAEVMNWVGGVKTPEAAQSLLGQGGIPSIGLVSGGQIVAFKLEHVWVEAFVDYIPSRGAKHRVGDTWVAMDGSFKQYDYAPGMDITGYQFIDAQNNLPAFIANFQHNDAEGWFSGLDTTAFQALLADGESQLHGFYRQAEQQGQLPRRQKTIVPVDLPMLPGSLPYPTTAGAERVTALPNALRLQFKISLYTSDLDQAADSPFLTYQASLPQLAGKRLTLDYLPASEADRQVIASYLPAVSPGSAIDPALWFFGILHGLQVVEFQANCSYPPRSRVKR